MSRSRIILLAALVAVVLAGGGWWIATHFERVPVTRDVPPQPEALHNHYLALERFMARMGRPIVSTGDVRVLEKLKPGGVLILDRHHRAIMTQARIKTLFDWVGKGGYLIVIPENSDEPDPILSYLHVAWDDGAHGSCGCTKHASLPTAQTAPASAPQAASAKPSPAPPAAPKAAGADALLPASAPVAASAPAAADSTDASADDEGDDEEDDGADAPSPPRQTTFPATLPGSSQALAIAMQDAGLNPGDIDPAWKVALEGNGDWLLDYRYGLGNVSLIVDLDDVVSNDAIASYDHAEFFWKLLQHFQPTGPVTLMTRLPVPDLFDWLVDSAWTATVSALVLLALWLWQIAPRFGGTEPDAPPSRRELREHLNAIGRFVWRNEGLERWLEAARGAFRERLAMRHPAIAAMPYPEQAKALAQLTALPREAILAALSGRAGATSEFTAMLRTLKHLKHNL